MNNVKYIGMDVHSASISVVVLDAGGKQIMEATIPTQASAIVGLIQGLKRPVHAAFEEGTHAEWLYELLAPQVAKLIVCDARQMPRHKGEKKNDRLDARKLAEWLRLGSLKAVYHGNASLRALRELTRSYLTLVSDTTQVMNRLKAIYRGRGIPCAGTRVYSPRFRDAWRKQLRERGLRQRADLLIGPAAAAAPRGQKADGGREPEASRPKASHEHPVAGSGARGRADGADANAPPLSHQAPVVGLRRPVAGDAFERRLSGGQRPTDPLP
jgi:hypothetical protein